MVAMVTVIGDRFVRQTRGWLDLVTGAAVHLRLGRAPDDIARRAAWCAAERDRLPDGAPGLVDFGPVGIDGWFEAATLQHSASGLAIAPAFSLTRIDRAVTGHIEALAGDPHACGVRHVRLVAPPRSGGQMALEEIARRMRSLGFVTVRADLPLTADLHRQLCHRHLLVFVPTRAAHVAGARWVAELAVVSNRAHLLIERVRADDVGELESGGLSICLATCATADLVGAYRVGAVAVSATLIAEAAEASGGWPGRFADALIDRHRSERSSSVARERAVSVVDPGDTRVVGPWPFSVSLPVAERSAASSSQRLFARADRCHRIGRLASGDRWLSAGLEASRRRGDTKAVVRALEGWVPRLVADGRWHQAAAIATRALRDATDPSARVTLARLAASAHLEAGRASRAETCIDTAICIEQVTSRRVSDESIATRAAVRLWQGRWREGRAELEALSADRLRAPLVALWRELLAWAADDDPRPRWWPGGAESDEEVWSFALRLFRAAASGVSSRLRAETALRPPARDDWRRVVLAQSWLDLGDGDAAMCDIRALSVRPLNARGLVDAVVVSLRRSAGVATRDEVMWVDAMVGREGLRGLVRWGQGRCGMQMLHDVSQLLEIVQTSEDESLALAAVCRWALSAAGATGCTIVAAPDAAVMAGDALADLRLDHALAASWLDRPAAALEEAETTARAFAPIRYAGVTIGLVCGVSVPLRARPLLAAVQAVAAVSGAMLRARLDAIAAAARGDALAREIIGDSPAIAAVRASVCRAALAPFPVVIEGESGTGKELVARALHRLGPRRDRVFAALNCAALSDELVEAELFGHARGAFTHAVNARAGLFEEANHGTLFLDEVGDLSPRAQAKLLRVLQEGEIRRVGENESRAVDVRVVAATNRPLATLAAAGRFRDDLMFRLSVIRIQVPPLRARIGDVPALAMTFWVHAARRVGTRALLGPDALAWLSEMSWPGNVRELQNAMAALAVAAPATGRVSARLVRSVLSGLATNAAPDHTAIQPLDQARRQIERTLVAAALSKHTGSRVAAAHALGLSRQGLSKAMRRLGFSDAGVA